MQLELAPVLDHSVLDSLEAPVDLFEAAVHLREASLHLLAEELKTLAKDLALRPDLFNHDGELVRGVRWRNGLPLRGFLLSGTHGRFTT